MTQFDSSNILFATLTLDPSIDSRLKSSIENIKNACDELEKEAVEVISKSGSIHKNPINVATVGKRCVLRYGGPKASSIRNTKLESQKLQYIQLRSQEFEFNNKESIGSSVQNPKPNPYEKILLERIKYLEGKTQSLTKLIKELPSRDIATVIKNYEENTDQVLNEVSEMNVKQNEFNNTVLKLTNENHLKQFNLELEAGIIFDRITQDTFLSKIELDSLLYFYRKSL